MTKKAILLLLSALVPMSVLAYTLKRVSVHDPSIVWEPETQTYYIFGSHRAAAKTTDHCQSDDAICDLQGRRINNPQYKGIFIRKGKKYIR